MGQSQASTCTENMSVLGSSLILKTKSVPTFNACPGRRSRIGCRVTTATLGGTLTVPVSRRSQSICTVQIAQRINVL